ncbi:Uncharacterized protein FKW44_020600 [Caligus rogercresseyi]|uniref:Uncharacterized protein n=1 Tax=Caligus rogercresseyi TaxID=217165 RepID=A0A7T8GXG5_CALRO|nr:Uncharacterized protein FKW44_020600 [Caligus rogercresseyi]
MHLISIKLDGFDLTDDLPEHLVPPSKKEYLKTDVTELANGLDKLPYIDVN